ncbi:MAG: class I SAM-dependent methyltransferase [Oscillospiraceae bacterium]|jgi:SAM-dependent methyltransferase|nr:class I SAM-dependent methyltransferase [Oscillospiraceae bacterium]
MTDKNKRDWNGGAARYSELFHTEKAIRKVLDDPKTAFHPETWAALTTYLPGLREKRICVPSSGDNMAVFAFAALGASVTSCDFSENQLANAERVAKQYGIADRITFRCEDTRQLRGISGGAYDLVFTSNGVHVWIDDLAGMYQNIRRILKPGGLYLMFEIHPFQRPFDDAARVVKPYADTGPFESEYTVNFHWRLSDLVNAQLDAGLTVLRLTEMAAEVDYDNPFWIGLEDRMKGVTAAREDVDRMHDWHVNPMAALPNWLGIASVNRN